MTSSQVEHNVVQVGMPRIAAHKAVFSGNDSERRTRSRNDCGMVVVVIAHPVLDEIKILEVSVSRGISRRNELSVGIGGCDWPLRQRVGEEVLEIATTAVAKSIGVVRRSAVGDAFGGSGVGVAEVVGLWIGISMSYSEERSEGESRCTTYNRVESRRVEVHAVLQHNVVRGTTSTGNRLVGLKIEIEAEWVSDDFVNNKAGPDISVVCTHAFFGVARVYRIEARVVTLPDHDVSQVEADLEVRAIFVQVVDSFLAITSRGRRI